MEADRGPRVALVHDWLTGMRGGEKCLEVMCQHWPNAPLYTLLHKRGSVTPVIENRHIRTSSFRFLPGVHRYYRYLLPLMPLAARWTLPKCDLVVSLSHCIAKLAIPPPGTPHLCYCFTPMRYVWHMREAYFGSDDARGAKPWLRNRFLSKLRDWDRDTAGRVTQFVAISQAVRRRIMECYGRDSTVVYPPVDTNFFCPAQVPREQFYLVVSAFAPYKRIDLAIKACSGLGRELVVIGSGQDEKRLRQIAGPTVRFLGWQSNDVIRDHMRRCRALLFPGEEDFGIVPVEAQACGTPVIAFNRGGAVETVVTGTNATGILFEDQSVESLMEAVLGFERDISRFVPKAARQNALRFRRERFELEFFAIAADVARQSSTLSAAKAHPLMPRKTITAGASKKTLTAVRDSLQTKVD